VDLVGPGVREVFALQEHASPPRGLAQARRLVQGRRPADEVAQQRTERRDERRALARREVRGGEFLDGGYERFGNEASAELAEVTPNVGVAPAEHRQHHRLGCQYRHASSFTAPPVWRRLSSAIRTASKNARSRSGSF